MTTRMSPTQKDEIRSAIISDIAKVHDVITSQMREHLAKKRREIMETEGLDEKLVEKKVSKIEERRRTISEAIAAREVEIRALAAEKESLAKTIAAVMQDVLGEWGVPATRLQLEQLGVSTTKIDAYEQTVAYLKVQHGGDELAAATHAARNSQVEWSFATGTQSFTIRTRLDAQAALAVKEGSNAEQLFTLVTELRDSVMREYTYVATLQEAKALHDRVVSIDFVRFGVPIPRSLEALREKFDVAGPVPALKAPEEKTASKSARRKS